MFNGHRSSIKHDNTLNLTGFSNNENRGNILSENDDEGDINMIEQMQKGTFETHK